MGRLSAEAIDQIRAAVDIVEVVSDYVRLERSGRGWKGLCPFHNERTPSFHVDPDKQLFYCFGCHAGGNVFHFVSRIEGVPFGEAVRRLAERQGLSVTGLEETPEEERRRRRQEALRLANEVAVRFYRHSLHGPVGEEARRYLAQRGLSAEVVERFELGYAPPGWENLARELVRQGIPAEVGVAAGLLVPGKEGRPYDRFRHRVMFPIRDAEGRAVGFGGRSLDGTEPKYLNTGETALFQKGRLLYGLHRAREPIRRGGRALVVEGYVDVISLAQHGVDWAVAPLGTALTGEQVRLLARFAREVILAFDGDRAGTSAAERSLDVVAAAGLTVRVLLLPDGHDPDTYVQEAGAEGFLQLLERALPLMEFRLQRALATGDLRTAEGRLKVVQAVAGLLSRLSGPAERDVYLQRAAGLLGVSPAALAQEVARRGGSGVERPVPGASAVRERAASGPFRRTVLTARRVGARHRGGDGSYNIKEYAPEGLAGVSVEAGPLLVERALLRSLLAEPACALAVAATLGEEPFLDAAHNRLFAAICQVAKEPEAVTDVVGAMSDAEAASLAVALLKREPEVHWSWQDCVERWCRARLRGAAARIEQELAGLGRLPAAEAAYRIGELLQTWRRMRHDVQAVMARLAAAGSRASR